MATAPVAPPVVQLGRLAGWSPLPLSVRDARRAAADLRDRLHDVVPLRPATSSVALPGSSAPVTRPSPEPDRARVLGSARDVVVRYGRTVALRGVSAEVQAGEVVALMGRNGAGKSTLLNALVGLVTPASGTVDVSGRVPRRTVPKDLVKAVGLVPQDPADLLYAATVSDECRHADDDFRVPAGTCRDLLERLSPAIDDAAHPRDLSEGQRLCLALAVVLCGAPPLVLLDEPTRGLDYGAKQRLVAILRELAADGHAVLLSTHDVELVAEVATRVVVLADGEIVADGETGRVVAGSPAFAPQVAKILAPLPFLTVGQVAEALGRAS